MNATDGVAIQHAEFDFRLEGDWVRVPSADAGQHRFQSSRDRTSVVLSLTVLDLPPDRLAEVATKFAEIRQKAEQASRAGRTIQWSDKRVQLSGTGDAAEVAYAGHDNTLIFRFYGLATQRKFVSLWVATETRDGDFSQRVFDEVHRGFRCHVP